MEKAVKSTTSQKVAASLPFPRSYWQAARATGRRKGAGLLLLPQNEQPESCTPGTREASPAWNRSGRNKNAKRTKQAIIDARPKTVD